MLASLGRLLVTLYLIRVPLIVLLIMAIFGLLAVGPAKAFLGGVFDQEEELGLTSVALVAFLTAAAAVTAINLTLYCGTERFDLPFRLDPQAYPILIFVGGLIPPIVLFWCACELTNSLGLVTKVAAGLGGFLLASVIVIAAKYIQLSLTDPSVTKPPPPYLVFPADRLPLLGPILQRVYLRPTTGLDRFKKIFSSATDWLFRILPAFRAGYVLAGRRPYTLQSGHVFAGALALFSCLLYFAIGLGKKSYVGQPTSFAVPSLSYVLLALMVACWIFSALAFFLDRYRLPVLLAFLILTQITNEAPQADHFYRVEPMQAYTKPTTPAAVLERYSRDRIPVLIATAGGGIQASAWTAKVLASMDDECRAVHPGCDFTRSIAAVSSVSGGSVGSMHFGASYPDVQKAMLASRESSLDDVAWGWINPDVWRAVVPWIGDPLIDRGWALERSQEEIEERQKGHLKDILLSTWKADTSSGRLPAFLFNSTTIENGAPLVFATTRYRPRRTNAVEAPQAMSFEDRYEHKFDIRVVTAVRMSASFPFVSPAARSNGYAVNAPDWHLVDGGYYDNYGLFTLMDWLQDALEEVPVKPKKIVIVRIISFPPDPPVKGSVRGWGFQLGAPLAAFLNVRTTAQLEESLSHLRLFEDYWAGRPEQVNIVDIPLRYPGDIEGSSAECLDPPLSWKLTTPQKLCIDDAWSKSKEIRMQARRVIEELGYSPSGRR